MRAMPQCPLFFTLWQFICFFHKSIGDDNFFAGKEKTQKSVRLRFESVYMVAFMSEFSCIKDCSSFSHAFKQAKYLASSVSRQLTVVVERFTVTAFIIIPFNSKTRALIGDNFSVLFKYIHSVSKH